MMASTPSPPATAPAPAPKAKAQKAQKAKNPQTPWNVSLLVLVLVVALLVILVITKVLPPGSDSGGGGGTGTNTATGGDVTFNRVDANSGSITNLTVQELRGASPIELKDNLEGAPGVAVTAPTLVASSALRANALTAATGNVVTAGGVALEAGGVTASGQVKTDTLTGATSTAVSVSGVTFNSGQITGGLAYAASGRTTLARAANEAAVVFKQLFVPNLLGRIDGANVLGPGGEQVRPDRVRITGTGTEVSFRVGSGFDPGVNTTAVAPATDEAASVIASPVGVFMLGLRGGTVRVTARYLSTWTELATAATIPFTITIDASLGLRTLSIGKVLYVMAAAGTEFEVAVNKDGTGSNWSVNKVTRTAAITSISIADSGRGTPLVGAWMASTATQVPLQECYIGPGPPQFTDLGVAPPASGFAAAAACGGELLVAGNEGASGTCKLWWSADNGATWTQRQDTAQTATNHVRMAASPGGGPDGRLGLFFRFGTSGSAYGAFYSNAGRIQNTQSTYSSITATTTYDVNPGREGEVIFSYWFANNSTVTNVRFDGVTRTRGSVYGFTVPTVYRASTMLAYTGPALDVLAVCCSAVSTKSATGGYGWLSRDLTFENAAETYTLQALELKSA